MARSEFGTIAEFYRLNEKGGYSEILGSDGIMYMDGRWALSTCHDKARELARYRMGGQWHGQQIGYRLARARLSTPTTYLTAAVVPVKL